jgi:hypothetical protein
VIQKVLVISRREERKCDEEVGCRRIGGRKVGVAETVH